MSLHHFIQENFTNDAVLQRTDLHVISCQDSSLCLPGYECLGADAHTYLQFTGALANVHIACASLILLLSHMS